MFVGKLTVAAAAWDGGLPWPALAVLANTVLSLFYYLRWIAPAFRRGNGDADAPRPWAAGAAVTAAVTSVAPGLAAGAGWAFVDTTLAR